VIGELDGPVGHALANLIGDQVQGHTRVFAILNSDVQIRPATVCVSKAGVKDACYTGILMGTMQAGIADGVLDAGLHRRHPQGQGQRSRHHLLRLVGPVHSRRARGAGRSQGALRGWLLEHQEEVTHDFHQLGLDGQL